MRFDQTVREQVQAQVGVEGVDRREGQVGDDGADRDDLHAAVGVGAAQVGQFVGRIVGAQPSGPGRAVGAQFGIGEPRVEHGAIVGDGGESETRGGSHGDTVLPVRADAKCRDTPRAGELLRLLASDGRPASLVSCA